MTGTDTAGFALAGLGEAERLRVEAEALAWWRKLQAGAAEQAELEAFGAWMATPAHAAAFADCEWSASCVAALDAEGDPQWRAWNDEAAQGARSSAPKVEPLANWSHLEFARPARERTRRGARLLKWAVPLAACLVVAVAIFAWQRPAPAEVLHYQAGHTTRQVLLPDGTYLTLDAGTAVDYVALRDERRLRLPAGRVYLRVAKDPGGTPFVVRSGQVETVVLGTRFQVSQTHGRTEVVLEEGRVRMQRPGTALATTLAPGERGWWTADATAFDKAPATPAKALAWTRGRLLFEDVPLAQAVEDVNRYSTDMQVEIGDPSLGQLRVSGSYLAGDPELVVAAWEATLPVKARHDGARITLVRK